MRENELFFVAGEGLLFDPNETDALFGDDGHLSDSGLQALIEERLDELERLEAAEHLAFCGACMERYTALLAGETLYMPSADLAAPVAQRVRQKGLRLNLRRYAAAAAAAAVALTLWGSGTFAQMVPQKVDILQQRPATPPAQTETFGSRVSDTLHGMLGAAGEMCGGLFQANWSEPPAQRPPARQDAADQQEPDQQADAQAGTQDSPEDGDAPQVPGRPANSQAEPARGDRFEEEPGQVLAREPASAMRGER